MHRPILLLSNISMIMELVINSQLQKYVMRHHLISHRYSGFRPHHSTADIVTIFSQKWSNALDRGYEVRRIAFDIKGAFDNVWHNDPCFKLKEKGISGKLLAYIENYLSNGSIKVVLSGQSSNVFSINASVPQGSILGPLLFSIVIDDLGNESENPLYFYAYDSTLFYKIRSSDDGEAVSASLNRDLDRMKSWADNWKVTFEPSKCKAMTISRKRNPTRCDLFLVVPKWQKRTSWKFGASLLIASSPGPSTFLTSLHESGAEAWSSTQGSSQTD